MDKDVKRSKGGVKKKNQTYKGNLNIWKAENFTSTAKK